MSNTAKRNEETKQILKQENAATSKPRRSPTMLKMQWIAERVRKCERIRKQVEAGSYNVDSDAVARAMLGLDK